MRYLDDAFKKPITRLQIMQKVLLWYCVCYVNIVLPMYNLLEYSDNYSMPSGRLWNYYREEINDD